MKAKLTIISFITIFIFSPSQTAICQYLNERPHSNARDRNLWHEYVKNNSIEIKSRFSNEYSDLSFLKNELKDKRIVFLGESCHGVNDLNVLKFRLLRYLHEELDFDVLIFEGNIGDCFYVDLNSDILTGKQMMCHSIFTTWWVKSNIDMFDYIKENDMCFAGMDIQSSGVILKRKYYNNFGISIPLTDELYKTDSVLYYNYNLQSPFVRLGVDYDREVARIKLLEPVKQFLIQSYTKILNGIEAETNTVSVNNLIMLQKIIKNKICELSKDTYDCSNYNTLYGGKSRDFMMACNFNFLADTVYSDKKIIVWAHNLHIAKSIYSAGVTYWPMGSLISEKLQKESYFIGLFVSSGENNKFVKIDKLNNFDKNSIESIMDFSCYQTTFLQIPAIEKSNHFNSFMFTPLYQYQHGDSKFSTIMSKSFDALILLKNVEAIKVEPYSN